ncbi:MBL fold metallo-hydrolase [Elusimicrobiota bacterium]
MRLLSQIGSGGGSSVVVIRHGSELLMVDTGYEREADQSPQNDERNHEILTTLLRLNGIDPTAINKIFLTHAHADHCRGAERFDAELFCHHIALDAFPSRLKKRLTPLDDGHAIFPTTRLMHTPGHTRGHCSILHSSANGSVNVAICGDAIINLDWLPHVWQHNSDFFSADEVGKSAAKLLDADIVLPGHGAPFISTDRLKKLLQAP